MAKFYAFDNIWGVGFRGPGVFYFPHTRFVGFFVLCFLVAGLCCVVLCVGVVCFFVLWCFVFLTRWVVLCFVFRVVVWYICCCRKVRCFVRLG